MGLLELVIVALLAIYWPVGLLWLLGAIILIAALSS